jgi:hypothetical protein
MRNSTPGICGDILTVDLQYYSDGEQKIKCEIWECKKAPGHSDNHIDIIDEVKKNVNGEIIKDKQGNPVIVRKIAKVWKNKDHELFHKRRKSK